MDVMVKSLRQPGTGEPLGLAIVGFELNGDVQEVHELLQYTQRCFYWRIDAGITRLSDYQSERAATLHWAHPVEDLRDVLLRLAGILTAPRRGLLMKRGRLWANPAGEELRWLRGLYEDEGLDVPWEREQELDYRTIFWAGNKVPPAYMKAPEIPEDLCDGYALHDAATQVVVLQAAYRALMLHRVSKTRKSPSR